MRIVYAALFCFFLSSPACYSQKQAQDSITVLSTSMFDKYFQTIPLARMNGWIFKQGNDTNWAISEIDIAGWIKLNPTQLTVKNVDRSGRLEGWLRMRFKLDSS